MKIGDLKLLQKMQDKFVRRVEYRCNVTRHNLVLPNVCDRMRTADLKQFKKMLKDENTLDQFFYLRHTTSRAGFVIRPKTLAKTETINHMFPWRITRLVNDVNNILQT